MSQAIGFGGSGKVGGKEGGFGGIHSGLKIRVEHCWTT